MIPDGALLRRYAETGDQVAFAEVVQRQLGLVYGAALRQVGGDAHRAQDVAQAVFSDLARKAESLADRPVLASWLHTSTRFAATKLRRAEVRRWKHEQEAGAMKTILNEHVVTRESAAAEWERLRPVIDEAVQALGERDREAVLQRFFANRGFAEIGVALGTSEDAARMRVERALEKLRGLLARRGVTSTAAALGFALEAHAGTGVPAGLAGTVASQAVAGGASAAGTLAQAMTFMSTMKLAGGVAVGLLLVATLGTDVYAVRARTAAEAALLAESASMAALKAEVQAAKDRALVAEREVDALKQKAAATRAARLAAEAKATASAATVTAAETAKPFDPAAAGDAFMVKYPAVKDALGEYARARANFRFAELFAKLRLTPEQIERFLTLAASAGMGAGTENGSEIQLLWRPNQRSSDFTREMTEVLGADGMKLYQQMDMRDQSQTAAVHIAGALWFSDTPITPTQADQLVEVFQATQAKSGPNQFSRYDWDAAIVRARTFLAPAQLAVLEAERAHDEAEAALNRPMKTKTGGK